VPWRPGRGRPGGPLRRGGRGGPGTFASTWGAHSRIWWGQIRVAASFQARWYNDLPNINLHGKDRARVRQRAGQHMRASGRDGTCVTQNLGIEIARVTAV